MTAAANAVLVTGAYGFVGAAYCAHLAQAGVPYVGVVRERARDEMRDQIRQVGDFVHADWATVFENSGIDCVVHLAARAHHGDDHDHGDVGGGGGSSSSSDPGARAAYRRENVKVTDRLLAAARLARARRLVFSSTVKVHGEATAPGVILRESDPLAPHGEYAHSKALAEQRVRDFGRELGMESVILRLPLVYGPGAKANFAELVAAVRARRILPLGAVRNQRSLLGLGNLCSALEVARTHPDAPGQTFLVSDGEDVSTPELVRAIAAAFEVRPRLWSLSPGLLMAVATLGGRRAAARRLLESLSIDSARIRRSLQWSPPLTLAEELARLAAHMRRAAS